MSYVNTKLLKILLKFEPSFFWFDRFCFLFVFSLIGHAQEVTYAEQTFHVAMTLILYQF